MATASAAQVRQGVHTRGIDEWRRYQQPLLAWAKAAGISAPK
ncbi:hypothetical protein B3C1_14510 [Gallaecimonas xiamenensis 3-C-1]|uniref:Uncharacterized protein n=1 Tax=Gallaecimonas xiamenensis 3-C-1 TaxID=745411 RepID=K2J4A3_9GAMM|nr:hypothetical protein B3C1_14510 [Gallaecimonas xiamenensis 3-C-1]